MPSLRDSGFLYRPPGTAVPGVRIPPFGAGPAIRPFRFPDHGFGIGDPQVNGIGPPREANACRILRSNALTCGLARYSFLSPMPHLRHHEPDLVIRDLFG